MPRSQRQLARQEVGSFLASRRARTSPEAAGLPGGGRRRVPGLRREEVALLAGISVDYYARLERGLVGAVSDQVLASLAAVLHLDRVEADHLRTLVRRAAGLEVGQASPRGAIEVAPELRALLALVPGAAVFVRNARLDVLAHNELFGRLYDEALETASDDQPANLVRYLFTDPRSRVFYRNWERLARGAVGALRAETAQHPDDPGTAQLVAQLSQGSNDFATLWESHAVEEYQSGEQHFRHHLAGELDLAYQAFTVLADPRLTMIAYHALPGSPAEQAVQRLRHAGNPAVGH